MITDIGQRIRSLRKSKGISLNAFAEKLNVSAGYLSNLEKGKTDTISWSFLLNLQNELHLLPLSSQPTDELDARIDHCKQQLKDLNKVNSEAANYLLTTFEKGLEILK